MASSPLNTAFGNALVAAALRKGQVKTSDLLAPGMYDPALDWQAQNEGLGFQQQYGTQPGNLNPGSQYNVSGSQLHENLFGGPGSYVDPVSGQRYDYSTPGSLADLATRRDTTLTRAGQAHDVATGNITRGYQNLASHQLGNAEAAGVAHGGALQQALAKRTANQARDQGQVDTSWRNLVNDTNQGYEHDKGAVLQGAGRTQGGLDTGLANATASNALFNQQLGEGRVTSAQQMGTLPDLPTPSFSPGHQVNQAFGNALAAAYYKRLGQKVPGT